MHYRKNQFLNIRTKCPNCENLLSVESSPEYKRGCKRCDGLKLRLRCRRNTCDFESFFCEVCDGDTIVPRIKESPKKPLNDNDNDILHKFKYPKLVLLLLVMVLIVPLFIYKNGKVPEETRISSLFKNLKQTYPSQKNETWPQFLSVLEKKIPSVKTITFLYNEDKKTTNCLTNELVFHHSGNKTLSKEDKIIFSSVGFEGKDYGVALKHYIEVVKKYGVLITDLNNLSGNLARIFHTLCDEVSSNIKPSLFIFSLDYENKNKVLKPVERATKILKKNWKDLPESDLFPLLPRIVKNVVDIVPEMDSPC